MDRPPRRPPLQPGANQAVPPAIPKQSQQDQLTFANAFWNSLSTTAAAPPPIPAAAAAPLPPPGPYGFAFQAYDPAQLFTADPSEFTLLGPSDPPMDPHLFQGALLHQAFDPQYQPGARYDAFVLPPEMQTRFFGQSQQQTLLQPGGSAFIPPSALSYRASYAARSELIDTVEADGMQWKRADLSGLPPLEREHVFQDAPVNGLANHTYVPGSPKDTNVPTDLTEEEVVYLTKLYRFKYSYENGGDFVRALTRVGFFNGASEFDTDEQLSSAERIDAFLTKKENMLRLAALLRVDIYRLNLNDKSVLDELRPLLRKTLVHFFANRAKNPPPNSLDYIRKTLESNEALSAFEDINAPDRDLFFFRDNQECMFLSLYNQPKVISAGSYGFVLAYRNKRTGNLHAVKFQRIEDVKSNLEAAYTELRIMYSIQQLTRHWNEVRRLGPFNYVRLDEWVRCRLDTRAVFKQLLPGMPESTRKHISNRPELFQIIVQQLAGDGDLHNAMGASQASLRLFFSESTFAATVAQVLGHVNTLNLVAEYTHNDLKPENCLLERQSAFIPYKYLVYPQVSGSIELYVPLKDTLNHIIKVADQGLARMRIGTGEVVPERHKFGWDYANPARDLESFALTTLALLMNHPAVDVDANELMNSVSPAVYEFIKRCIYIHGRIISAPDITARISAQGDYVEVIEMLNDLISRAGRLWTQPNQRKAAARSAIRLYREHRFLWERPPTATEAISINELLRTSPLFERLRARPADLSASNSIIMTDYKK